MGVCGLGLGVNSALVLFAGNSVDDDWHEAVIDAAQFAALAEESA